MWVLQWNLYCFPSGSTSSIPFKVWGRCREGGLQAIFIMIQTINVYIFVYLASASSRRSIKRVIWNFCICPLDNLSKSLILTPLHSNTRINHVWKGMNKSLNVASIFFTFYHPSLFSYTSVAYFSLSICEKEITSENIQ